ncbi:telomere replication protein EST3 [Scheffersomyces amazonensis]|uniref:telomere replication protein EST3 n=1 Tax=Scheffersomyces amazonensis TaxID=1078765 RepID=UPI00315DC00B
MGSKRQHPLPFLQSWLQSTVETLIRKDYTYSHNIVAKNFIQSSSAVKLTPILRISSFIKTTKDNSITAVLTDSTHKILVKFPFKSAIINFENTYKRRITQDTVHTLVVIKDANLIFQNRQQLKEQFDVLYPNELDIIVLEILDLTLFQQEQIKFTSVDNSLHFIYDERWYARLCIRPKIGQKYISTDPDEYEGMISHDEDSE